MAAVKNPNTGRWELEIAGGKITLATKDTFIDSDIDIICTANTRDIYLRENDIMKITDHLGNTYILNDDPTYGVSLDNVKF